MLLFLTLLPTSVHAAGASLYLSPASGTFLVGSTFNVSIFVNTGDNHINTMSIDLKFDPNKLQVASPTAGKSFISIWAAPPSFSNTEGLISFKGGIPSPGINTSSGLISTVTFRAAAPGRTAIKILESSEAYLNDGAGSIVPVSTSQGIYEITIPPPEGPMVQSSTHPDPNKWYKNSNPVFAWDKEEGVTDFSYSLDQIPDSAPDNISEGGSATISYSDLKDGIWYFHIKAKKAGLWGGISHYFVQIDNSPPADFVLKIDPALRIPDTTTKNPTLSFLTTDSVSGLSHYEIKIVNLSQVEHSGEGGFFMEAGSPYRVPTDQPGEYEIVVRAYDWAGNYREVSKKIEIIDVVRLFYVSRQGLGVFGFFFYWWQMILFIVILCAAVLFFVWLWRKKHNRLDEQKRAIEELKAKIVANEQEIRKKLNN